LEQHVQNIGMISYIVDRFEYNEGTMNDVQHVSYDAIKTADGVNPRVRRDLEKSDWENCFRGKC